MSDRKWDDDIIKVSNKDLKRAFVRARINKICECQNRTILVDRENRLLECSECGAILDPFDVVADLEYSERSLWTNLQSMSEEKEQLQKWMLNNRMGQTLRNCASQLRAGYVPQCPDCGQPFEFDKLHWCWKDYAIQIQQQKYLKEKK